mmetsp:Transcript_36901/g.106251  ORF Transcript_36901/g.106251 Transcript_36901/m.106251 type:complete len:242 (+) Transcript_36901:313-1038(+)
MGGVEGWQPFLAGQERHRDEAPDCHELLLQHHVPILRRDRAGDIERGKVRAESQWEVDVDGGPKRSVLRRRLARNGGNRSRFDDPLVRGSWCALRMGHLCLAKAMGLRRFSLAVEVPLLEIPYRLRLVFLGHRWEGCGGEHWLHLLERARHSDLLGIALSRHLLLVGQRCSALACFPDQPFGHLLSSCPLVRWLLHRMVPRAHACCRRGHGGVLHDPRAHHMCGWRHMCCTHDRGTGARLL